LGEGESETLAIGRRSRRALVDDGRATRAAEALGVTPVSTLFLHMLGLRSGWPTWRALGLLHRLAVVTGARAETVLEIEARLKEER